MRGVFIPTIRYIVIRNAISQSKTNRCNSYFSFIKIRIAQKGLSSLGKVQYKHL